LEQLRQGGSPQDAVIQALAKELRLTHTSVLRLLAILAAGDVPPEQAAERVAVLVGRHISLVWRIGQLPSDDPVVGALRDQAVETMAQGDYRRAEVLLARAETELAEGRHEPHPFSRATQSAARGETLLAEGNYLGAAEQFAEAATLAPDEAVLVRMAYLTRQAQALVNHGDERGDNDALAKAVQVYSMAFNPLPLTGVRMMNALGSTLRTLGERKLGSTALERAIAVHRSALGWLDREDVLLMWAWTQNHLGMALWRLGERERGTARLEEAVETFRAALEEQTRERVPFDWAQTRVSLGLALHSLDEREIGTSRLEAALEAYRAALDVYTREAAPFGWAMIQNNRGNTLLGVGERDGHTTRIQEAVAAYRAALEELSRERVPLDWAMVRHNLGNALLALGQRESSAARLQQAVDAFRAALLECIPDLMPLDWARSQSYLGETLQLLGEREGRIEPLKEALDSLQGSLEAYQKAGMTQQATDLAKKVATVRTRIAAAQSR
jgi:tetratricopeptide (TPR) repeat protein